jgi:hypothetical protein
MLAIILMVLLKTITVIPESDMPFETRMYPPATEGNLERAIRNAHAGDTLFLKNGVYEASQKSYIEYNCGNCLDEFTRVEATVGFRIDGRPITILGEHQDSTVLITNAGYGILFDHASGSRIANLTITGGRRDLDANATDAAIVVKNSRVTIEACRILNNWDMWEETVVGIGGIMGREGSDLIIHNNLIAGNSWDGVALYRGSKAVITDNVIMNGRGACIGITWDARAEVHGNRCSGYWKGIGAFGDTYVTVTNNAVFDNIGWGIVATGEAHMEVINNVIYHNGNCGFATWTPTVTGQLTNNIIVENGWHEEWVCPGVGIWMKASLYDFPITYNNVWHNYQGEYAGVEDQTIFNGNISMNPMFRDIRTFELHPGSPCKGTGDPTVPSAGSTRSDMGLILPPSWRSFPSWKDTGTYRN